MHKLIVGLATALVVAVASPVVAEDETEEIQETEQPGSEFELDIDNDGKVEFGRKGTVDPEENAPDGGGDLLKELDLGGGQAENEPMLDPLDDPDNPVDPDSIDEELPGEGPGDLSGPDDDDPLPY